MGFPTWLSPHYASLVAPPRLWRRPSGLVLASPPVICPPAQTPVVCALSPSGCDWDTAPGAQSTNKPHSPAAPLGPGASICLQSHRAATAQPRRPGRSSFLPHREPGPKTPIVASPGTAAGRNSPLAGHSGLLQHSGLRHVVSPQDPSGSAGGTEAEGALPWWGALPVTATQQMRTPVSGSARGHPEEPQSTVRLEMPTLNLCFLDGLPLGLPLENELPT
ncbi:uncharacterized protein LOC106734666 [Tupaia chinensis]|uniref:uncharacterized protein LOC106734666 n=1 Tax=Tupaia chinensis TaxID=246437 RepID=UPI00070441E6|nr:uncharacterized protein LOC106734666 [Tupaia chinensis]